MNHHRLLATLLLLSAPLMAQCTATHAPTAKPAPAAGPVPGRASHGDGLESRLLPGARQLIFDGRRSGEGYFSHDGWKLIFQSEREPGNPFFQIYVMDLRTGETRRVSPGYGKATCAWLHPSGERVLFASTHLDPRARAKQEEELERRAAGTASRYSWDYDEHFELFEGDPSGGRLRNLTRARGYDAEASWSPDGNLIVFASNRHAYAGKLSDEEQAVFERDRSVMLDIYRMNADGTDVRRLTDARGADGGPFFSPDGRKIVWRRFSEDGTTAEVFTMNTDGSEPKQITRLGAMSWAPYFHPSGDYLIFSSNPEGFGNFELYAVDAEGRSEPVRITYTDGFDGLPVFSPEGRHLAWTSNRTAEKQSQIFIAGWNDAEVRRLLGIEARARPRGTEPRAKEPAASSRRPDPSRTVPAINADDLRLHVTYLASDALGGRMTGSEGERQATEYAALVLESYGLEPAGDGGTYFQSFEFTAGVSLGPNNRLVLRSGHSGETQAYAVDVDWRPLAFSRSGDFEPGEVVFAGYGIVAPAEGGEPGYDSYAGLDVAGKWVLVLRYLPEGLPPEQRHHLNQFASLRYKAMVARDRGARGMIVASGPTSNVKDELIKLSFDASLSGTNLGAISITDGLAERLLTAAGKDLAGQQAALDRGEQVSGFRIPGVTLEGTIDIRQEKRTGRNVLARLPRGDGDRGGGLLIVGAHLDHLGEGTATATLARREEEGMIHHGADDNASGVAGVLEIAQHLADEKAHGRLPMRRDVLFALWSGEELGLLGSSHFARTFGGAATEPPTLAPDVAAYLNMDMIGRLDTKLVLLGVGSSPVWSGEIERRNAVVGLPVVRQNTGYLPTDATSFYVKGVPVLSAFTGSHPEYHTPRDTADTLNYPGTEKVVRLMAMVTRSLAGAETAPEYVVMEKPGASVGRTNLRAYLGTIPDYAAGDVVGVRLTGVAKGGPADQAGVRPGDVIIGLGGRQVDNIYDYTYALDLVKIGVPVEMSVRRSDQDLTFMVTPTSRD